MPRTDVLAAGVVVFRPGRQVLLVHRPRYDDWSFPKGKLDPGEHLAACAVREVEEETGLRVRLGPPLPGQRYPNGGDRMKTVSYWTGRVLGEDDVRGYTRGDEIDRVAWVDLDVAAQRLTYPHDRETLRAAVKRRKKTRALVVLRHAEARARKAWTGEDRLRPLVRHGREQAGRLLPVLEAYDVSRVVTSSSTRCVQTVTPYVRHLGGEPELLDALTEEDATAGSVLAVVDELVEDLDDLGDRGAGGGAAGGTVLCTHRPVLPSVFDALGLEDPRLEPGSMLVAHLRKGRVVATEVQRVR